MHLCLLIRVLGIFSNGMFALNTTSVVCCITSSHLSRLFSLLTIDFPSELISGFTVVFNCLVIAFNCQVSVMLFVWVIVTFCCYCAEEPFQPVIHSHPSLGEHISHSVLPCAVGLMTRNGMDSYAGLRKLNAFFFGNCHIGSHGITF